MTKMPLIALVALTMFACGEDDNKKSPVVPSGKVVKSGNSTPGKITDGFYLDAECAKSKRRGVVIQGDKSMGSLFTYKDEQCKSLDHWAVVGSTSLKDLNVSQQGNDLIISVEQEKLTYKLTTDVSAFLGKEVQLTASLGPSSMSVEGYKFFIDLKATNIEINNLLPVLICYDSAEKSEVLNVTMGDSSITNTRYLVSITMPVTTKSLFCDIIMSQGEDPVVGLKEPIKLK